MNKYTPGPWRVKDLDHKTLVTAINDIGHDVVICRVGGSDSDMSLDLDNAKLISAAPELLQTLEILLEVTKNIMSNDVVWARSGALDAIKKARGE